MAELTTTLTPYLCCRNANEALEFYQKRLERSRISSCGIPTAAWCMRR